MSESIPSVDNGIASPVPSLNIEKLAGLPDEQKDLYILTFSGELLSHAAALNGPKISACQGRLKQEVLKLVNLISPFPSKPIRTNAGRCLAEIFRKGDRKLLFEAISELLRIINAGKEQDLRTKHAAAHCLGEICGVAGDSAISQSSLVFTSLIRLLKPAQAHSGLRHAIFIGLAKSFTTIAGAADESVTRDVWASARKALINDKAVIVQAAAAKCLKCIMRHTSYFENSGDFESLKVSLYKVFESRSSLVRHAAASCLAATYLKCFAEEAPKATPKSKKPKKASNKQAKSIVEDEEEIIPSQEIAVKKTATRLTFGLREILVNLSTPYTQHNSTNRVRAAIISCFYRLLRGFKTYVVETNYLFIAENLLVDVLSNTTISNHRYRYLLTRKYVSFILEDVVGQRILGEAGQIRAAKTIIDKFLKNYPQAVKEHPEPSKQTLTGSLHALASLITSLGAAASAFMDQARDALLQVLKHPSYTVQIAASYCLGCFSHSCPQQILPCAAICTKSLEKELSRLGTPQQAPRKCVGLSQGLAAIISTSPSRPLYGSVEVNAQIFSLATKLLKASGESDLRTSAIQIQVAWILIGGLMALGPKFIKIHLSQLLLLWRNALPKPLPAQKTSNHTLLELSFLAHVRECALGSILLFLRSNDKLITADIARRLAMMLQNTTSFLSSLPEKRISEDISQRLLPSIQLHDYAIMVTRRVLQIYTKLITLSPGSAGETIFQFNTVTLGLAYFADPEQYSPVSLSSSIANAAGNYDSIWEVGDNSAFGITGLVKQYEIRSIDDEAENPSNRHVLTKIEAKAMIDDMVLTPIIGAREHDSLSLFWGKETGSHHLPDPPASEVVNSAIKLLAVSLPLQIPKVQESVLEQLLNFLSMQSLQRDPGRKAALKVNISVALFLILKVALNETGASAGDVKGRAVEQVFLEMLRNFIVDQDEFIRNIGSEALAMLCSKAGNSATASEINHLVDVIVTNRDPYARAGCAAALGCIHSKVGGMAASLHLKTIYSILMSLANDPHPAVHFWALESISRVGDSAGLTFAGYVPSTLGILGQLYMSDVHNEETSQFLNSNMEVECPTVLVISKNVDMLINALGPDLQEMAKARDMIITLVRQLEKDSNSAVFVESLKCLEHLSLYASNHLDFQVYVRRLQRDFRSSHEALRNVAIDGLYNLMKRDALRLMDAADESLNADLWMALDESPSHDGIRNVIWVWVQQTNLIETHRWLERFDEVMSKMKSSQGTSTEKQESTVNKLPDLQDEEVAGFATAEAGSKETASAIATTGQEPLKWQVRTFALECLQNLLESVETEIDSGESSAAETQLEQHVSEVIRIAFSASTSSIVKLRVWGLRIIDRILKIFGKTPDPDYAEASLLEQYQAQISSALTPAFAIDSSPELASAAINVCATFIATGIVKDVDRMGRILKLLVSALDNFAENSDTSSIGDLKGLSSNAQVMVRMAVFTAWAELQLASLNEDYLNEVLKPHISKLTPLWLASIREFARLRFEPDISMSLGAPSAGDSPDVVYSALNRETLLNFYQNSWLYLVDAIASLIERDSSFVFDALDGKTDVSVNGTKSSQDINYRDEPLAFFFVLFGICFEALAIRSSSSSLTSSDQVLNILFALKKILHPSVSGQAIYREVVFSETADMLARLVLTSGLDVQVIAVEIVKNLCVSHPSARLESHSSESLSEDIEQLFELTRIIVIVLAGVVPNLSSGNLSTKYQTNDETIILIKASLNALVDVAEIFPEIIKNDLYASIFHVFSTILGTASAQTEIIPQVLPIFKKFVFSITKQNSRQTTTELRGCFKKFLMILRNAQKRETEASLPCVKNCLLATTILLTGGTNIIPSGDPLLIKFLDEVIDDLDDRMVAKIVSNCIRSLLLHIPKNDTDDFVAAYLLPRLLSFVTTTNTEDPVNARGLVSGSLVAFAGSMSPQKVPQYFSALIPTFLTRAQEEGTDVYQETAARLLELASINESIFKLIVARLSQDQKDLLGNIIKAGGQRSDDSTQETLADKDEAEEPSIALRMNFG